MAKIQNTRFPHRCTIYEVSGVTPFSDGEKRLIWSGRCRKEEKTVGERDGVPKTNYRVHLGALIGGDLPGDSDGAYKERRGLEVGARVEGLKAGLLIDVTDAQGAFNGRTITDAYCGMLGTSVCFCDDKT